MARPKNAVPTLLKHKHSGLYYIWINGNQVYLGRDLGNAERERARLILDPPAAPQPKEPSVQTVAEAFEIFVRNGLQSHSNHVRYQRAIDVAVELCGGLPTAQFRSKAVLQIRERLLRETAKNGKAKKPLSRSYINQLVGCLVTSWTWLVTREVVPAETLGYLQAVPILTEGEGGRETDHVTPPPAGAVAATLPFLPSPIDAMVRVQALIGVRPGELVSMRRSEISITPEERLSLPRTKLKVAAFVEDGKTIWVHIPSSHKTLKKGKPRAVVIGPMAQAILKQFDGKPDEPIFQRFGKPITVDGYSQAVMYAIRRANAGTPGPYRPVPDWTPNQLRHQAGTEASEQFDRESAAALLGHAGMDAIDVYAMQALRKAAKVAAAMG